MCGRRAMRRDRRKGITLTSPVTNSPPSLPEGLAVGTVLRDESDFRSVIICSDDPEPHGIFITGSDNPLIRPATAAELSISEWTRPEINTDIEELLAIMAKSGLFQANYGEQALAYATLAHMLRSMSLPTCEETVHIVDITGNILEIRRLKARLEFTLKDKDRTESRFLCTLQMSEAARKKLADWFEVQAQKREAAAEKSLFSPTGSPGSIFQVVSPTPANELGLIQDDRLIRLRHDEITGETHLLVIRNLEGTDPGAVGIRAISVSRTNFSDPWVTETVLYDPLESLLALIACLPRQHPIAKSSPDYMSFLEDLARFTAAIPLLSKQSTDHDGIFVTHFASSPIRCGVSEEHFSFSAPREELGSLKECVASAPYLNYLALAGNIVEALGDQPHIW